MESKWQKVTLAEAGAVVLDCEHKTPAAQKEGIPYLAIPNVQQGRIDLTDVRLISQQDYEEWTRRTVPQPGDVLLTRRGRVGDTAAIPSGLKCAIGQNLVLVRSKSPLLSQEYLRWALTGPAYRREVYKYLNVGAIFDSLNVSDIPKFEIALPPLPIQRQIASILSAFDDKVELNRQMNHTLEQVARALFKSWFVDFDPVRTKMRGERPEGMDAETAALFPSELVEIDEREVPTGWAISRLGDIAEIIDCLHSKKPDRVEQGLPYIQLNNIGKNGQMDLSEIYQISEADYRKWTSRIEVREGDCVITNVGRVGAVCKIPSGFVGAIGRNMTAIRLKKDFSHYSAFLIELLVSDYMRKEIEANTDAGTILNALNVKSIPKLSLILPDPNVLGVANAYLDSIRTQIEHNLREIDLASKLRDALLPRLMSGEIDVTNWINEPEQVPA